MEKRKSAFQISTKIMALIAMIMIIFGGTVFVLMYQAYADNEVMMISESLEKSAKAIAGQIDGDEIIPYIDTLTEDENYEELFHKLSDFKTAYGYTFVYIMAELDPETYVYIADGGLNREHTDDLSLLGDTDAKENYDIETEQALKQSISTVTPIYDNGEWGDMLSAFAPIQNAAGKTVAVVGVDVSADLIMAGTAEKMRPIFIKIAIATAVLFLLVYLSSKVLISRIVITPLNQLKRGMEQIAAGSLDVRLEHKAHDEMGQLSESFNALVGTLQCLLDAVDQIKGWAIKGELRNSMEERDMIRGRYREIIQGMNNIMKAFADHLDCLPLSFTIMDMDYKLLFANKARMQEAKIDPSQFVGKKCYECREATKCHTDECPGKQAMMAGGIQESEVAVENQEMQSYASPFEGEDGKVIGFMEVLVDQTKVKNAERVALENAGQMERQMELAHKQSDYQKKGVQALINSLEKLARGDLDIQLNDLSYDEDTKEAYENFYRLEKSLVDSCAGIKSYIDELGEVLGQIADKNLEVGIDREYKGDFSTLKTSINHIIQTLNSVFNEILLSTEQVENAASQVSNSAQSLAHGASEQAGEIEQISATVTGVATGTRKNAENANKANEISYAAKEDAQTGNQQMSEMVAAMEAIKESSRGIANIIKVIDDIAFQTNILALNAAVEAARAGEQGKGFAVVAGEVRNLAARSAAAAKETTELIDTSLMRVETGAQIADDTARALEKIVEGVTNTVDIVATIAEASASQASAIAQIDNGIEQISKVTQSNTATAEASASSSEEMAAQTQVLQNMMREFRLQKGSGTSGIKLLP